MHHRNNLPLTRTFTIALLAVITILTVFAMSSYRQGNAGTLLFEEYFSATPAQGYATQRSLAVAGNDTDASILHQGKLYHQQQDYDLALMSLRAFLESNPVPATGEPLFLAATAASATGHYAEAAEYLAQIAPDEPEYGPEASWHTALLLLKDEKPVAARPYLEGLKNSGRGNLYPVEEVLKKLQ